MTKQEWQKEAQRYRDMAHRAYKENDLTLHEYYDNKARACEENALYAIEKEDTP